MLESLRHLASGLLVASLLTAPLGGCKPPEGADPATGRPRVVATTTMIADLARQLGGERVEVDGLLAPGGDPHLYQPVTGDSQAVARAQLVLINGLSLEGWMEDLVRNAGGDARVVVVSQGVEPLDDPLHPGNPDPHFWFDATRWITAAGNVRDALIALDPDGAATYEARAAAYIERLRALDARVRAAMGCIPAVHRRLVTSHDAFQYFGAAYGLEVEAVQGVSTESEASGADQRRIIEYVNAHEVPAVFIETSVRTKEIEAVQRSTRAAIGGALYSDSLGAAGSGAETYVDMMEANARALVEALSGAPLAACAPLAAAPP